MTDTNSYFIDTAREKAREGFHDEAIRILDGRINKLREWEQKLLDECTRIEAHRRGAFAEEVKETTTIPLRILDSKAVL